MRSIALIPARGGSKRIPRKNVRPLAGHPLVTYTIKAALASECFDRVLVSSDDNETMDIASRAGADIVYRDSDLATDTSPDIEWVTQALIAASKPIPYEVFSILRPTSPFRMPETIQRAFLEWTSAYESGELYSSLRAVEKTPVHPGKMYRVAGRELVPLLLQPSPVPFHDSQYASLPTVYAQNASLEIAWTSTVEKTGTISGDRMMAFMTSDSEGFDLNTEYDWQLAEQKIAAGEWVLPDVS